MSLPAESMSLGSSCLARQRSARQAEATPGRTSSRVASARQDEKGVPWFWKILWGGDRDTLLMLYRTIVRPKLHYGRIVSGTAPHTNLRQLGSIHNAGLRLALGAFCTSPVSSMYTEANEAPLEERRLKLFMNYYLKTRAALTTQHILPYMNLARPQEICIFLNQIEKVAWLDPLTNPLVSR